MYVHYTGITSASLTFVPRPAVYARSDYRLYTILDLPPPRLLSPTSSFYSVLVYAAGTSDIIIPKRQID